MSDCVCCENRRSRPRWSVTLATTATAITGTAAMMENKATMRTCSRDAARPRRLACDDEYQKKDRDRVCEQQRDHDLVRGRNRREAGEHDEGQQCRQQRQRNSGKAERSREPSRRRRCGGSGEFSGGGFADVDHRRNLVPNGNLTE